MPRRGKCVTLCRVFMTGEVADRCPRTHVLRISTELFETQTANRRHVKFNLVASRFATRIRENREIAGPGQVLLKHPEV